MNIRDRASRGIAAVTVLLVLVAVAILVLGTAFTTLIDRQISSAQQGATDAYYVALAGLDRYKTETFQTFRYMLDHLDLYEDELSSGLSACGNILAIGLDRNRDGDVTDASDLVDGRTLPWEPLGNGRFRITFDVPSSGRKYIVLTAEGQVGRSSARVRMIAQPRNAGPLSYAVFSNVGHASGTLNGGLEVFGSIHIVGDPSAPNAYVIDSNGNFQMHNYYRFEDLVDATANSNVDADDLRSFLNLQAEEQEDLCAFLRVENGKVALSGSAQLGGINGGSDFDPAADADFKTTLAGAQVDDGIAGGDPDITDQSHDFSASDYASTGRIRADSIGAYDLETSPVFPVLDDTQVELKSSSCRPTSADGSVTWRECIHDRTDDVLVVDRDGSASYVDTSGGTETVTPLVCRDLDGFPIDLGAIIVDGTLTFGEDEMDCQVTDASGAVLLGFRYDPELSSQGRGKGLLEVTGIVNFRGLDLVFAQNVAVKFAGQSTFFAEGLASDGSLFDRDTPSTDHFATMLGGNIVIEGDLVPANADDGFADNTFPNDSVIGMIADNTFHMTGDTQNTPDAPIKEQVAMGLFYAGNEARIDKGGVVFGTVVAQTFTMSQGNSGGTSKVIQVPGLEYNETPGLDLLDQRPTFRVVSSERL